MPTAKKASSTKAPKLTAKKLSQGRSDAFKQGLKARMEVLGPEYVLTRFQDANAFTKDLQDFLTEHAWGAVWARKGLPKKTRSMLVLAMMCAANRPHELEVHIKGALNNGVTPDEMKEVFLQAGVYVGAPAALDAFSIAQRIFKEKGLL
jgi:4-carboxymuconolactone decarboxylase